MLMNQSDIDARMLQQSQQIEMVNANEWRHSELRSGRDARPRTRARLGNALIALGSRLADAPA